MTSKYKEKLKIENEGNIDGVSVKLRSKGKKLPNNGMCYERKGLTNIVDSDCQYFKHCKTIIVAISTGCHLIVIV